MKEQRDTPRSTMTDEEMVKDYPRLAREYTLLHQDYREAIRKPLIIADVIVPKGTLCLNCNKDPANRGIGETKTVCSKCWNSMFKHNAL